MSCHVCPGSIIWSLAFFLFAVVTHAQTDPTSETVTPAAPIVVTYTVDSAFDFEDDIPGDGVCLSAKSDCTLRAALEEAEATPIDNDVLIEFDIAQGPDPAVDGVWTIRPQTPLPSITRDGISIDGESQKGAACGSPVAGTPHVLKVELDGTDLKTTGSGLYLFGVSYVVIRGLAIGNFPEHGVRGGDSYILVECMHVGTDAGGGSGRPNAQGGITLDGGTEITVRNVIASGNGGPGVTLNSVTSGGRIEGSFVGLDASGKAPIPNSSAGIDIVAGVSTTVGAVKPGIGNVVSGNTGPGIRVNQNECVIIGNYVGLDVGGTGSIPNVGDGVSIAGFGAQIGGTLESERNVISGNEANGIMLGVAAEDPIVEGNYLGTNASGTNAVPNGQAGIKVNADGALIGGLSPGSGNLISGNTTAGVYVDPASYATQILGNQIGTNALGSGAISNEEGIFANSARVQIGSASGGSNRIAYNRGTGIVVTGPDANATIQRNRIYENGQLGIDLGSPGPTGNDPLDADSGPNGYQNYPIFDPIIRSEDVNTDVTLSLSSEAETEYRVEIFRSPDCDPSGYGEGYQYVTTLNATTDASGVADLTWTVVSGTLIPGRCYSATATVYSPTGWQGPTSEFSPGELVQQRYTAELDLHLFLEGPFDGAAMTTSLNAEGLVPDSQPYTVAPWAYDGLESLALGDEEIVDWLLLGFRVAPASPDVVRMAAVLQPDGNVVAADLTPLRVYDLPVQNPYLVVYHRNHLPIMSSSPVDLTSGTGAWDFTTAQAQAWGATDGMRQLAEGVFGMFGGDANANGLVEASDQNESWAPHVGTSGYVAPDGTSPDIDLNGQVQNTDKYLILVPNLSTASQVPGL